MHLSTLTQKRAFIVRTIGERLEYVPLSTEKRRLHQKRWLRRVCDAFNCTNSLHPVDYIALTVNASYTLAVIDAYLKTNDMIPLDHPLPTPYVRVRGATFMPGTVCS